MGIWTIALILLAVATAIAAALKMQPGITLQTQIATLIAGDVTTLANATALKLHLASANFTPSPNLTVASFTEATFAGYAALNPGTGAQLVSTDPLTGLITVEMKAPAGGWRWATTSATGLPQTIYGWYLTDSANTTMYGCGLLPVPVTLTATNQSLELPPQRFAFLGNSPQ